MALWRQLSRGFRGLFNRSAADRDIADEVEHYLEEAATAFRRADRVECQAATRAWQRDRRARASTHHGWEHIVESHSPTSGMPRDGYAIRAMRRLLL